MNIAQCTCHSPDDDATFGQGVRRHALVLDEVEEGKHVYRCLVCGKEKRVGVKRPEAPRVEK